MAASAGELYETMKVRLGMQEEGITNPRSAVKIATRELVKKLSKIDSNEEIEVSFSEASAAKYVRVLTGKFLLRSRENETHPLKRRDYHITACSYATSETLQMNVQANILVILFPCVISISRISTAPSLRINFVAGFTLSAFEIRLLNHWH